MTAFPLNGAGTPSYFTLLTATKRAGLFFPTDTVGFTLNKSGATAYTVRDYTGATTASGSVSGTTLTIPAPSGGWRYGFYRVYLTGPSTDANFGPSYGANNFSIVRNNPAAFPANAAVGTNGIGSQSSERITAAETACIPVRWTISNALYADGGSPNPSENGNIITTALAAATFDKNWWQNPATQESARPRQAFVSFDNKAVDMMEVFDNVGNQGAGMSIYPKTETVDGSQFGIGIAAGSSSGFKLTVYAADLTTILENYDNLANGVALVAATASSSRIKVFERAASNALVAVSPTLFGRSRWNGVQQSVNALYPTITWFEGPLNEPYGSHFWIGAETAHAMRIFYAAVKGANSSALVLGPGPVDASPNKGGKFLDSFFAAGGGAYCDGISFHNYNMVGGDIPAGRRNYDSLVALLTSYGQQAKPRWITEDGSATINVFGVYHPRHARWWVLDVLMAEQIGVPRERHVLFNDTSNGFWSIPCWMFNSNGHHPHATLQRTLVEETFNRPFASRYQFGNPGDALYIGSLYTGSDGSSAAVFMANGVQLVGQVTLTVTGATNLTVIDAWGNSSTVPVSSGRAVIPVQELPVYVRLPSGVTATLYSYGDRPPLASATVGTHLALDGTGSAPSTAQPITTLSDGGWTRGVAYDSSADPFRNTDSLPSWAQVKLPVPRWFDRVTFWAGTPWQSPAHGPVDFDVQTSMDGTSWTTQKTVTVATPTSFVHGDDDHGTGCQRETFWDEASTFDMKLPAKVRAQYLRIFCRAASYGGEPDAAALLSGGQGDTIPHLTAQEIGVYCDDTAVPRYVVK